MEQKQRLVIILPESMSDIEVQVVRGDSPRRIIVDCGESESAIRHIRDDERRYVMVWNHQDYLNVRLNDILWISASGSYSVLHLAEDKNMIVSCNLSAVERKLPASEFVRIHRSCVVSLSHVRQLVGNTLNVEGTLLHIGREYREIVLSRFIFIGTRRNKSAGK